MSGEEGATVIWPFYKLDCTAQIGTDLTPERPMYLIGVGSSSHGDQKVIVQRFDYSSGLDPLSEDIKIDTISPDFQQFKDLGIYSQIKELIVN